MNAAAIDLFRPTSRQHWRMWLQEHHATTQAVWLVYARKGANLSGISYNEAVEEALCFGWIDSKAQAIDNETYKQFFCRRKSTSGWSKVNKARIQRLLKAGLLEKAGLDAIEQARRNGSWTLLDELEALAFPDDLIQVLETRPTAKHYIDSWSRSDKRAMLQWLLPAKRTATRQHRITQLVELADQQIKPALLRWTKK